MPTGAVGGGGEVVRTRRRIRRGEHVEVLREHLSGLRIDRLEALDVWADGGGADASAAGAGGGGDGAHALAVEVVLALLVDVEELAEDGDGVEGDGVDAGALDVLHDDGEDGGGAEDEGGRGGVGAVEGDEDVDAVAVDDVLLVQPQLDEQAEAVDDAQDDRVEWDGGSEWKR